MATRLTDRGIAALKPTDVISVYHFDSEVHGLLLRVYPSGRKSIRFRLARERPAEAHHARCVSDMDDRQG